MCNINDIMYNKVDNEVSVELRINVKAIGDQVSYMDSEWSQEYICTYIKKSDGTYGENRKLSIPLNIDFVENKIVWDLVEGAISYQIEIIANGSSNIYNRSTNYLDVE